MHFFCFDNVIPLLLPSIDLILPPNAPRRLQVCVASGKQISSDVAYLRCKACKHPMIEVELGGRTTCPLCHSLLPIGGAKVRGAGSGAGYGRMGSVRE